MTFDELLTRDGPAVERFIKFRVDSPEDAEDILQDTLLAAFRGFPSLRDQSAFKPWLLEIARRKIADHFRRAPDTVPIDTVPLERLGPPDPLALLPPWPEGVPDLPAPDHPSRHREKPPPPGAGPLPSGISPP